MTEVQTDCTAAFPVSKGTFDPCYDRVGSNDFDDADDETRVFVTLLSLIDGGFCDGRTRLADAAAEQSGVTSRCALGVLDRYTGTVSGEHFWSVRRAGRGQSIYTLVPSLSRQCPEHG